MLHERRFLFSVTHLKCNMKEKNEHLMNWLKNSEQRFMKSKENYVTIKVLNILNV